MRAVAIAFLASSLTATLKPSAGCFPLIIVASPSVHLGSAWEPVKHYVHTVMGVPEEEQCFFDTFDPEALSEILGTQRKVVEFQERETTSKKIYGICMVVDDFADSASVMASRGGGNALNHLLVRGRHIFCSCKILSQKLRAMGSTIVG